MTRRSGRRTINKDPALEKPGSGRTGAVQVMCQAMIGSPEYKSAG